MKCPICDGNSVIVMEHKKRTIDGLLIQTIEHYYKCDVCNEEFTTTEIDTVNYNVIKFLKENGK